MGLSGPLIFVINIGRIFGARTQCFLLDTDSRTRQGDGNRTRHRSKGCHCILLRVRATAEAMLYSVYIYIHMHTYTSSTAQGGGGSFKVGNLSDKLVVANHGWQSEATDGSIYLSIYLYLSIYHS